MEVNLTKVHKPQLTHLHNIQYENLLKKFPCQQRADELTAILNFWHTWSWALVNMPSLKQNACQGVGSPGQPEADKVLLGWTIMSPGGEIDTSPMLLIQTSSVDYQELCQLNVLGLADLPENNQEIVYTKFRELTRESAGWYKTGLPWKGNTQIYPTITRGARDSCDLYWGS